jgi:hypothetical protein
LAKILKLILLAKILAKILNKKYCVFYAYQQ